MARTAVRHPGPPLVCVPVSASALDAPHVVYKCKCSYAFRPSRQHASTPLLPKLRANACALTAARMLSVVSAVSFLAIVCTNAPATAASRAAACSQRGSAILSYTLSFTHRCAVAATRHSAQPAFDLDLLLVVACEAHAWAHVSSWYAARVLRDWESLRMQQSQCIQQLLVWRAWALYQIAQLQ
eukprot:901290-Prymnesium_polylepis.2